MKEASDKNHVLCNSICMKYPEKASHRDSKLVSHCLESWCRWEKDQFGLEGEGTKYLLSLFQGPGRNSGTFYILTPLILKVVLWDGCYYHYRMSMKSRSPGEYI